MKIFFLIFIKKILNRLSRYFKNIDVNSVIVKFIEKDFKEIIEKYKKNTCSPAIAEIKEIAERSKTEANIWVFWWQGYEAAPVLVKKCIESVRKNAGTHTVILLTKDNWQTYADIPEYIIKKVSEGNISLTHFSDILRMALLADHGGLWLDATIFVSQSIPDYCFTLPYFSIHYKASSSKITQGRWTGFCQGACRNSIIQCFCRDIFFEYWKKYARLVDYFFIDYTMLCGYKNIPAFKQLVDSVPLNNEGIKELDLHFSDTFSKEKYESILENSTFFKLNWKRIYKTENNGQKTFYSCFLEE
ncbi:MAG: capsular polysaccharide synthesis protein [Treponema sp.]|nr:capsular polysaccharide synthesis protein [Treponema sp.]